MLMRLLEVGILIKAPYSAAALVFCSAKVTFAMSELMCSMVTTA